MRLLVTGAAGFIGSSFARQAIKENYKIVILDALTYAGHMENIQEILKPGEVDFIKSDIRSFEDNLNIFNKYEVDAVINFAAESHVDNSISGPKAFIETNILGTFSLLEASRCYFQKLTDEAKKTFRYLQISTDEVYGTLGDTGKFHEKMAYQPNSPYSASKASSDHLVRAWFHTYKLPTITTNCSNNYGPRQFPEKLIPVMITKCLNSESLPVYGTGGNIRDWIHSEDHSQGVLLALQKGQPGETYCFGGNSERNNLDVVKSICTLLDELKPRSDKKSYHQLISFVQDRAGHDWRYAIDDSKAQKELGFTRKYRQFEDGLRATVIWYLENRNWIEQVKNK
ncbi:MAG: dTDP-glucose 4,6-dehydratase [Deltaproteobacteria bacterium]|nr:dTDP-glucose 4,6-dehydratase [Deltaproteobacteria bacterium]